LIILSKIDARNGAIGVIPEQLDNSLISSTFLLFQVNPKFGWLNPYFLVSWLTTDYYQEYFESLSKGTTNRRSINSQEFLSARIDLSWEELKQKNLAFTKQQELESKLELELKTVRRNIKEIITKK
jgi:type I restriction enzyme S subunit